MPQLTKFELFARHGVKKYFLHRTHVWITQVKIVFYRSMFLTACTDLPFGSFTHDNQVSILDQSCPSINVMKRRRHRGVLVWHSHCRLLIASLIQCLHNRPFTSFPYLVLDASTIGHPPHSPMSHSMLNKTFHLISL